MFKVLLVDDEILVRDAIRENIDWNALDYELVADCQNGREAIEYVEQEAVDLVLTDIAMPYVDGMELSKFLYNNYPDTLIIIFSGFSDFEYAKKAIQYKVSEYILKPVTAMELTEVLKKLHSKLEQREHQVRKIDRLTRAYETYRKNESMIRSKSLTQLVKGTQELTICLQELSDVGITLRSTDYRVAVVDLDAFSELHHASDEDKKDIEWMSFVVENISNEIMENYQCGMAFRDDNRKTFLLFETNKPKEFKGQIRKICEKIQSSIYETVKFQVSIGIGTYVQDLADLHVSYESAVSVLAYRYTGGEGLLIDREEEVNIGGDINIEEYTSALSTCVKSAQSDKTRVFFQHLEEDFWEARLSKDRVVLYLQQITRAVYDVIRYIDAGDKNLKTDRNKVFDHIADSRSCGEAMEYVKDYALKAIYDMENLNQSSGQKQAMLALDYIQQHYGDVDLSLNTICNYLSISTSHFSSVFKETTGETFMEVLIRTRMQKAKELIEKTTLRNYEIAERVGFSDPHYFSISFKKMTGKSPTEYAKEHR